MTPVLTLRERMLRGIVEWVLRLLGYRVQKFGTEYIPASGGVLLLGNHLSYLDWAVLLITCPRPLYFVLSRAVYRHWRFIKPLSSLLRRRVILISQSGSKNALTQVQHYLHAQQVVVLFPEGGISRHGQMETFQKGFEKVAAADTIIIPFYLVGLWGAWGSQASSVSRKLHRWCRCQVVVGYGQPLASDSTATTVKQAITTLSVSAWQQWPICHETVAQQWLLTMKKMPRSLAIADATGKELSSLRLVVAVSWLRRQLASVVQQQAVVGILLPTSVGGVIANLAVLSLGKVIVNLNFTTEQAALHHAVSSTHMQTIISSRAFLKKLQEREFPIANVLTKMPNLAVIYLEDLYRAANKVSLLWHAVYCKCLPLDYLSRRLLTPVVGTSTAAILFSSGSEGMPKGIELTHQNLVSNVMQIIQAIQLEETDALVGTMPLFHAFGLTVNVLTPLLAGVPLICQPDPTDGLAVAKLVYRYRATILTGTPTFLNLYCRQRKVHPLMLQSLRFVIAGAEKLAEPVARAFKLKFGLSIYEGYGTTETAPVASVNLPDIIDGESWRIYVGNKANSVGLPLPGTAFRIVDPETLAELPIGEAGLILIGGPQVKLGYWQDIEKTRQAIVMTDGIRWYKTGDKGYLDQDGFLYIIDRYSRFAKIGGEMVSLARVEQQVLAVINEAMAEVMALAIPDNKKGERIILLYCASQPEQALQSLLARSAIDNLLLPAQVIKVKVLPKLGSGKQDYQQGAKMVAALLCENISE